MIDSNSDYSFPLDLLGPFKEAFRSLGIPGEFEEDVLSQIDYAMYSTYFVNPELEGQAYAREFVSEAFNEINRERNLGYPELPMSERTWFPDDDYYIPSDFNSRSWQDEETR